MSQNFQVRHHTHLRFHEVHGDDVVLHNDHTVATRIGNTTNGLIFTSRPVKLNEKISIKLVEVSEHLDVLHIGFSSKDPSTLNHQFQTNDLQDLKHSSQFWICKIYKMIEKRSMKNKTLFFYIDDFGTVRYGLDDEEKGAFEKKITTADKIWGLIDIRGAPMTIQLMNYAKCNLQPLMLHQTRGRNVKLVKNKALKADKNLETSYVFTARPLYLNERVVIKVVGGNRNTFALGLTSCNPSALYQHELPPNSNLFINRAEYWVLIRDSSWNLKKNDEISFCVKSNGFMKIVKNSSTVLTVVRVDPTLQLWGLFDFGTLKGIQVESCQLMAQEERRATSSVLRLPSAPPLENVKTEKKSEEDEVDKTEGASECVVCCENAIVAAMYPCGHMCMCYECAQKQWQNTGHCPLCRSTVTDVVKIYKS